MPMIIDRFEEAFAVCEKDGETVLLPRVCLPAAAAEGDALIPAGNGFYAVDAAYTAGGGTAPPGRASRRRGWPGRINALKAR